MEKVLLCLQNLFLLSNCVFLCRTNYKNVASVWAERCFLEILHMLSKITDWTWNYEYGSSWICSLEQGPVLIWKPFMFHWLLTASKIIWCTFIFKRYSCLKCLGWPLFPMSSEETIMLYMGQLSCEQALLLMEVSREKVIWKRRESPSQNFSSFNELKVLHLPSSRVFHPKIGFLLRENETVTCYFSLIKFHFLSGDIFLSCLF